MALPPPVRRPAPGPSVNIAAIALKRAWLAGLRGDAEAATVFAERARAELHDGEWMLELLTRWHLATADWLHGRLSDAERTFAACAGELARAGEFMLSSLCSLCLGQIQCAQGRLDAATETYQSALKLTAPADRPARPAAGYAYVGMGEVAYQQNDLEQAHGDVGAAAQWAAERGIGPDEPSYPEEAAYLALARVLLAQGRPGQALRMLATRLAPPPGRRPPRGWSPS